MLRGLLRLRRRMKTRTLLREAENRSGGVMRCVRGDRGYLVVTICQCASLSTVAVPVREYARDNLVHSGKSARHTRLTHIATLPYARTEPNARGSCYVIARIASVKMLSLF